MKLLFTAVLLSLLTLHLPATVDGLAVPPLHDHEKMKRFLSLACPRPGTDPTPKPLPPPPTEPLPKPLPPAPVPVPVPEPEPEPEPEPKDKPKDEPQDQPEDVVPAAFDEDWYWNIPRAYCLPVSKD